MSAPPSPRAPLLRALPILVCALLAVGGCVTLPPPFPWVGLGGDVALALSHSGKYGLPVVILGLVAVLVTRPGLEPARRRDEACSLLAAIALVLIGMAAVNEFVLKRGLRIPRPNIAALAAAGRLGGKTAADFYALGDKEARRAFLAQHLVASAGADPALPDAIREHWLEETGFSFPSGHATASSTLAGFFLTAALALLSGARRTAVALVIPWAVAVCWSRVALQVHSPLDVSVGALQGLTAGALGFAAASRWLLAPPAAAPLESPAA